MYGQFPRCFWVRSYNWENMRRTHCLSVLLIKLHSYNDGHVLKMTLPIQCLAAKWKFACIR